MKKVVLLQMFLTSLFVIALSHTGMAQKLIARQTGETTTFYTDLNEAITQAVNDDVIYIPGGYFELSVGISKKIHLIGEGHNPESSKVNGVTYINTITANPGSDGSSFHGLYLSSLFGIADGVKDLLMERCNIGAVAQGQNLFKENMIFNEVVFRGDNLCSFIYGQFNSCIFSSFNFGHWRSCTFRNNIFLSSGFPWYVASYASVVDYSMFENNIFITAENIRNYNFCTFKTNMFVGSPIFDGVIAIGMNNITNQQQASIFEFQSGNIFLYEHNYHLKKDSPWIEAAGKEVVGLYGGPSPWKDGSVPFNPHVESKDISTYTNALGNLKVDIKVSSQER